MTQRLTQNFTGSFVQMIAQRAFEILKHKILNTIKTNHRSIVQFTHEQSPQTLQTSNSRSKHYRHQTHVPINSNTSSASIPNANSSSLTPKIFNCSSVLNPVISSLVMVAVSGLRLLLFGNAMRGCVDGANAYVVDNRRVAIIDFMIMMCIWGVNVTAVYYVERVVLLCGRSYRGRQISNIEVFVLG